MRVSELCLSADKGLPENIKKFPSNDLKYKISGYDDQKSGKAVRTVKC